ncbi:carboxylating nicotinate-nucleotide diphosphorylase [Synechococcus sp. PCC 7336]|uniref:carboxylating nicotinate-nucleotide diphosphorylase n=1 Tax=Synechococcus sp. PCC 7336 TaxID=195250 RepID=UPI000375CFCD|nr:carboxylating nicotinate-nucleotide diphosphorylase [Synechococcus sp. PCC 7336]
MPVPLPPPTLLNSLIHNWLCEDWGRGDRTTLSLFPDPARSPHWTARICLKRSGLVAGLPITRKVWQQVAKEYEVPAIEWEALVEEGTACEAGTVLARVSAPAAILLMGERVALNQLGHLSGIATLTRQYVEAIADLPAQLVDTRKTRPGLRDLEKYAVAVGGGTNHRFGLDDAVMLKDNHILAAGGIAAAVRAVRARAPYPLAIEVETETLEQVEAAIAAGADIVMLDNMPLEPMARALEIVAGRAKTEASGNITLERIRSVAELGVDYVSTSATIMQATWLDVGLDFVV